MHEWFKQCAKKIPGQVVMPQAGGGEAVRDQLMNVSDLRRRTPKHPTPSSKKYWLKHKMDMAGWIGPPPPRARYRQQEWPCEAACITSSVLRPRCHEAVRIIHRSLIDTSAEHLLSALDAMDTDAAFTPRSQLRSEAIKRKRIVGSMTNKDEVRPL